MKILDVGCGKNPYPDSIGIDRNAGHINHDLDNTPYPFDDATFDMIYSRHTLEHLKDFDKTMIEFHRLLKPNGILEIIVPFYASYCAFHPSHKTFFNYHSFDLYLDQENSRWSIDTEARFKKIKIKYHFYAKAIHTNLLNKLFYMLPEFLANKFPLHYQRFFANIFPCYEIQFVLKKVKK